MVEVEGGGGGMAEAVVVGVVRVDLTLAVIGARVGGKLGSPRTLVAWSCTPEHSEPASLEAAAGGAGGGVGRDWVMLSPRMLNRAMRLRISMRISGVTSCDRSARSASSASSRATLTCFRRAGIFQPARLLKRKLLCLEG